MTQPLVREHVQVIVRAYVWNPPKSEKLLARWCREVIEVVGMKCIAGPLCVYSDMEGNKGYTAVAVLDFSHLSIHVWDEISPALIEFDLFSCKSFDIELVLKKLDEFGIKTFSKTIINRDEFDDKLQTREATEGTIYD